MIAFFFFFNDKYDDAFLNKYNLSMADLELLQRAKEELGSITEFEEIITYCMKYLPLFNKIYKNLPGGKTIPQDVYVNNIEPLKKSILAAINMINSLLKKTNLVRNKNHYLIKLEFATGRAHNIPYITIKNSSFTKSDTHGFYTVLLFDLVTTNVYISLNIGGNGKEYREFLIDNVDLGSIPNVSNLDHLLEKSTQKNKHYFTSNIVCSLFTLEEIKKDSKIFINTLNEFLKETDRLIIEYKKINNEVDIYGDIEEGSNGVYTRNLYIEQQAGDDLVEIQKDVDKTKDSWIDVDIPDKNFLGRKTVDKSTYKYGTVIPLRYHKVFLDHLSEILTKKKSIKIKLLVNDKEFPAVIRWPSSKKRTGITVQLLYSNKALLELLREKLEVSYNYIIQYEKTHGKKPSSIPEEYQEYIDFYKGDKKDTFILELISKTIESTDAEELEESDVIEDELENEFTTITSIKSEIDYIYNYITSKGFFYSKDLITNFYLSLKTKPFVILSGISGTGKSKFVELFAEAAGANEKNKRFNLISVRPDWSDATDLLGYRNIESKFVPGIIMEAAYQAMRNSAQPYFVCLDEMNLARVEYYFSDILSSMETRKIYEDEIVAHPLLNEAHFGRDEKAFDSYGDVFIPQNLYIIGTVNMDETTFPFSKKVLDRANTIEFNKVSLHYNFEDVSEEELFPRNYHNDFLKTQYLKLAHCKNEKETAIKVIGKLIEINTLLEKHQQHFGYRVRDEIVFYVVNALKDDLFTFEKAMDYSIVQKILPKIGGSGGEVLEILVELFNNLNGTSYNYNGYIEEQQIKAMEKVCKSSIYKASSEKIMFMIRRFIRDGFTTFWQ